VSDARAINVDPRQTLIKPKSRIPQDPFHFPIAG